LGGCSARAATGRYRGFCRAAGRGGISLSIPCSEKSAGQDRRGKYPDARRNRHYNNTGHQYFFHFILHFCNFAYYNVIICKMLVLHPVKQPDLFQQFKFDAHLVWNFR
jgi:hypothetical protein